MENSIENISSAGCQPTALLQIHPHRASLLSSGPGSDMQSSEGDLPAALKVFRGMLLGQTEKSWRSMQHKFSSCCGEINPLSVTKSLPGIIFSRLLCVLAKDLNQQPIWSGWCVCRLLVCFCDLWANYSPIDERPNCLTACITACIYIKMFSSNQVHAAPPWFSTLHQVWRRSDDVVEYLKDRQTLMAYIQRLLLF